MPRYIVKNGQHVLFDDMKADDADHVRLILTIVHNKEFADGLTIEEVKDENGNQAIINA